MTGKGVLKVTISVFLIGASLWGIQRLLMPKYMDHAVEGAFIAEYYQETLPHELLILGDCEVYENISPVTLWREYGITSFIRGSAQQLVQQSYYLLEDALRYEKPKVVLFSVAAMQTPFQVNEAYNRMTLDGMRWSASKYEAIQATRMEDEQLMDYVFPLLRYHSRWKELNEDDIQYYWKRNQVSHNGYYMRADVQPVSDFPTQRRLANYQFDPVAYEYLDKIRILCEENSIQLILMKAPSLYPVWHEQWDQQIQGYAQQHDLTYINFIPRIEEIGLDFTQDTYNGGQHLNVYGAEKMSVYLGRILGRECEFNDYRTDPQYALAWEEKCGFYDKMKEDQIKELEEYGYLQQFHVE